MPKPLPWVKVFTDKAESDYEDYIRSSKSMKFGKGNKSACTVCLTRGRVEPHSMQYKLAWCASATCAEVSSYAACKWRAKILRCDETGLYCAYELFNHICSVMSPKTNKLIRSLPAYVKTSAQQEMKPAVIRNHLIDRSSLSEDEVPLLSAVQNCVSNYRRYHMSNNDLVETIVNQAKKYPSSPSKGRDDPVTIGFDTDAYSNPLIGCGSDEDPFVFGLTTARLITKLGADPDSFIFHIDATFKLNQSGYPVVMCGISGKSRSFSPVAFFVVSQRTEPIFERIVGSLGAFFLQVTGRPLQVKYVMGDADAAQHNAVMRVFGEREVVVYLMCFYHVIAKVAERVRGLARPMRKKVFDLVYEMHYARSQRELEGGFERAWNEWTSTSQTIVFAEYFYKQWLTGKFMRWQCYHTPAGFATTNNPVEQFNRVIKRDYTLRTRLKVGNLIEKLASCCHKHSMIDETPKVTKELKRRKRRMLLMVKCGKHSEAPNVCTRIFQLMGQSTLNFTAQVVSTEFVSKEEYNQLTRSEKSQLLGTMSVSNARMEFLHIPTHGWSIDIRRRECQCNYFFEFACCVHVLYALHLKGWKMPWEGSTGKRLKNRTTGKRRIYDTDGEEEQAQPGRPRIVGFALSFE